MASTTTKAVLAAENAMLRKQIADLKLDIEMINSMSDQVEATLQRSQQRAAARAALRPQWQIGRAEAMAEAKEMAVRCRCVVKV